MTIHSNCCACSICWSGNRGAFADPHAPETPRYVHCKSVGDSFGVWVLLAFTSATFMFIAYKFWEGLLN